MKFHFIGIDGISMSALAAIIQHTGHKISGSDLKKGPLTLKLISQGAVFFNTQIAKNITDIKPDVVVYTAAIDKNNPELLAALASKAKVYDRASFLGELANKYDKSVAISGSHGKTTTTAMLTSTLVKTKMDPTALVGGELEEINGNVRIGNSEIFVTEACEYVESFLKIFPHIGIILNIDKDHLDYFQNIEQIVSSFIKFSQNIKDKGFLIINNDNPYSKNIIKKYNKSLITFGINNESDWMVKNIITRALHTEARLYYKGKYQNNLQLQVPGHHNIYNALAVIACCNLLGINSKLSSAALSEYKGTHRRFELRGKIEEAILIDDYAHHPNEIKATLAAIKTSYPKRRIIVVFQAHTFSRTKSLLCEFSNSFLDADIVYITPTYPAREAYDRQGDSKTLSQSIKKNQDNIILIKSYSEAAKLVYKDIREEDIIITMGAGPVNKVIDLLLEFQ